MSTVCPGCQKTVMVEDVVVRNYRPTKILQTCGRVVIRRGGRIAAELVEAHQGLEVQGALQGNVVSGGPVLIGSKAQWRGDCRAPSLVVKAGARVEGGHFVIPDDPLGLGGISDL